LKKKKAGSSLGARILNRRKKHSESSSALICRKKKKKGKGRGLLCPDSNKKGGKRIFRRLLKDLKKGSCKNSFLTEKKK